MPSSPLLGDRSTVEILLDDSLSIEVRTRGKELVPGEMASQDQLILRDDCDLSQVPRGTNQAISGQVKASHLSYQRDGRASLLHRSVVQVLELQSVRFVLIAPTAWQWWHLLMAAGMAALALQLRRPLWSLLHGLWLCFAHPKNGGPRDSVALVPVEKCLHAWDCCRCVPVASRLQ